MRIASWNADGLTKPTLSDPNVLAFIKKHHWIAFQEAKLSHPGAINLARKQLDSIGYFLEIQSRPTLNDGLTIGGGGVAIAYKKHLAASRLEPMCGYDCLALDFGDHVGVSQYLAPYNTPTQKARGGIVDLQERHRLLCENLLAFGKPVVLLADWNAALGSLSSDPALTRITSDSRPLSGYGESLISSCRTANLTVLNGTTFDTCGGSATSFHSTKGRNTVIDVHCPLQRVSAPFDLDAPTPALRRPQKRTPLAAFGRNALCWQAVPQSQCSQK
jgi:hypothetical protein